MVGLLLFAAVSVANGEPRVVKGDDAMAVHLLSEGPLAERLAPPDDAEWALFYAGEQRGDLAPCGCSTRPRGGLPRAATVLSASNAKLFVNLGGWLDGGTGLDGNPIPEAELKNQWMIRGLKLVAPAAVHVSFEDLLGLPPILGDAHALPLLSSNLHGPGIEPVVYASHNDLRFAFIGISHPGAKNLVTPNYERLDPYQAGVQALESIPDSVDRVVLLNHGATSAARRLAKTGRIDLVIDTHKHRSLDAPFKVGDAIWIRSHERALRLGEIRVGPSGVTDRKIDLDDSIPSDPAAQAVADDASEAVDALRKRLFGP